MGEGSQAPRALGSAKAAKRVSTPAATVRDAVTGKSPSRPPPGGRLAVGSRQAPGTIRRVRANGTGLAEAVPRGRVLVAEDNAANRMLAARLLEKRGFRVDLAAGGREALERYERGVSTRRSSPTARCRN